MTFPEIIAFLGSGNFLAYLGAGLAVILPGIGSARGVGMVGEAAGGVITDTTRANVKAAGTAYGKQVRRLLDAGAAHVAMTGVYNLGNSPWAKSYGDAVAQDSLDNAHDAAAVLDWRIDTTRHL